VAIARERERQQERDAHVFRSDIRRATVAVQRSLATDPILKRAAAAQRDRERLINPQTMHEQSNTCRGGPRGVAAASHSRPRSTVEKNSNSGGGACGSAGAGGRECYSSSDGGHSKEGDEVLRRARETMQRALGQI